MSNDTNSCFILCCILHWGSVVAEAHLLQTVVLSSSVLLIYLSPLTARVQVDGLAQTDAQQGVSGPERHLPNDNAASGQALVFEALVSEALVSEALVSEALVSEALVSEALVSEALVSEALVSEALVFEALVSEALVFEALVSEALVFAHS
ncbi:unnamed protein product [Merluccius merluccius]